jgi:hypothetical protein
LKNIFEDIGNYMQMREFVLSFLLTEILLLVSLASYSRLSTTEITVVIHGLSETHTIHIIYYGFPFEMLGILNPLGTMENYWVQHSGQGLIRVLWSGLLLNFILYFLFTFFSIYLFRKFRD